MSLIRESVTKDVGGYKAGDMKVVGYNITFTANQLVIPAQDPGWVLLNGSVVSQTTYPVLFARFGTKFNTGGEGVGNFRLPDFTDGKIPLPKGLSNFASWGASTDPGVNSPTRGGEINHTITTAELATHSHTDNFQVQVSAHAHTGNATISASDGSHYHLGYYLVAAAVGGSAGSQPSTVNVGITSDTTTTTSHSHSASTSIGNTTGPALTVGGSISATGGGGSHNNMQPYLVVGGWLVKLG